MHINAWMFVAHNWTSLATSGPHWAFCISPLTKFATVPSLTSLFITAREGCTTATRRFICPSCSTSCFKEQNMNSKMMSTVRKRRTTKIGTPSLKSKARMITKKPARNHVESMESPEITCKVLLLRMPSRVEFTSLFSLVLFSTVKELLLSESTTSCSNILRWFLESKSSIWEATSAETPNSTAACINGSPPKVFMMPAIMPPIAIWSALSQIARHTAATNLGAVKAAEVLEYSAMLSDTMLLASWHIQCSSFGHWQEMFNYTTCRRIFRRYYDMIWHFSLIPSHSHHVSSLHLLSPNIKSIQFRLQESSLSLSWAFFPAGFDAFAVEKNRWSKVTRFAKLRPTKRWRI